METIAGRMPPGKPVELWVSAHFEYTGAVAYAGCDRRLTARNISWQNSTAFDGCLEIYCQKAEIVRTNLKTEKEEATGTR